MESSHDPQVYRKLLGRFRRAWSKASKDLRSLNVFAPSRMSSGPGYFSSDIPSFDPAVYAPICSVHLPIDPKGEVFTAFPGFVVAHKRFSSEATRGEFKRLCGDAGAALPERFRARLSKYVPSLEAEAASWWLALLLYLGNETASGPDGSYLGEVMIDRPFLLSINAIRGYGLDTDHPQIPGVLVNASGLDMAAVNLATANEEERRSNPAEQLCFTATEAGIHIGVHESTIRRWIKDQKISPIKNEGTKYWFLKTELDAQRDVIASKKAKRSKTTH